jgi:hypothetical protein
MPPGGSSGKTFIGPHILTRRQFLRGLGGGAAAIGIGSLQACESGVKERRGDQDDGRDQDDGNPTQRELFGRKGLSYLDREVTDPTVVGYLTERAASFGENCQGGDIPSDMAIALATEEVSPLDAGGGATNDLRLISPIDLERSPVLMDYLSGKVGRDVTSENASCAFTTTRFFAAATSKALGIFHPAVIGITDSVFASVQDDSGRGDQATADILVVDCAGVTRRMRRTINNPSRPRGKQIDRNENIPGRDSLLNAYFDYLVGYRETNGQKVYVPFDPSRSQKFNPSQGSIEYGGIRVVEYQKVYPDLGRLTSTPPPNASSQDSPNDANYDYETAENQGQLDDPLIETDIALAGGETYATDLQLYTIYYPDNRSVEYSFAIPQGAQKMYGDPVAWLNKGGWEVFGQGLDSCLASCDSKMSNVTGELAWLSASLAGACAFTGPGAFFCILTGTVLVGGMLYAAQFRHLACRSPGCFKEYYSVKGSPPG